MERIGAGLRREWESEFVEWYAQLERRCSYAYDDRGYGVEVCWSWRGGRMVSRVSGREVERPVWRGR